MVSTFFPADLREGFEYAWQWFCAKYPFPYSIKTRIQAQAKFVDPLILDNLFVLFEIISSVPRIFFKSIQLLPDLLEFVVILGYR